MNPAGRHPSLSILDRPFVVMGILNVTPDSFYDGGRYADPARATERVAALVAQGAAVIDIGGESTRPGAEPVSLDEERRRVLPVVAHAAALGVPLSIDTRKSAVAEAALDAGASWINDVSAGRADPLMAGVAARHRCPVILMHSRKTPADMQHEPWYDDVVSEVVAELAISVNQFIAAGVEREHIILDPGIGFAKRPSDNIVLLRHIEAIAALGCAVMVGASRKSFIGAITGTEVGARLAGSLAAVAAAYCRGVRIFRVHDVAETVDMLKVLAEIEAGR